ncbi:MAG TPA: phosphodiester glycosidase family protein [Paludibacteraceae bacterium]|nr:phosphodiester glycosidase family protein [Paludibacteraceae bacterium]
MKKNLLLITAFLLANTMQGWCSIIINGQTVPIDTIVYKQVGPGTMYAQTYLPEIRQRIYTLTIDLNNPYNGIQTFLARDCVAGTELVSSACARNTYAGKDAFGGINGDFFNVSSNNEYPLGAPRGGSIQDGIIQKEPTEGWWWAFATIDTNKKPFFDYLQFRGEVKINEGNTFQFSRVNIAYGNSDMTMYNRYAGNVTRPYENNGGSTPPNGYDYLYERTEVYITPVAGQSWGVNKTIRCKVDSMVNNYGGGAPIAHNQTILSGIRTAKTFLDQLTIGQEVEVSLTIRTQNDTRPNIVQLVGGNAVVMKNNVLTERNTSDGYNSMPYPRTGIASSADGRWLYLLVADGKGTGGSPGITTTEMCHIFQHMGATEAVGLDGGGSAEMIVNHEVKNMPSDGTERPVGNGWLVIANAPEDDQIAQLEFECHRLEAPIYGELRPKVMGFNQYGVLLNEDITDYTLSCSPNVGTINENGNFSATGTPCVGTLTATYNGVSVTRPITIVNSDFNFRLDSLLIDNFRNYKIEVVGSSSLIDPSALSWTVCDENICSITQGVLKGLSNGTTFIIGELGDFKDSLKVTVEIPTERWMLQTDFSETDQWEITAQSNWNAQLTNQNVPEQWEHGNAVNYTYQTNRSPSIRLSSPLAFYSLPDSIKLTFNTGNIAVTKLIASFKSNNKQTVAKEYVNLPTNEDVSICIATSELFDTTDISIYPIWLDYLRFQIAASSQQTGVQYALALKDFLTFYPKVTVGFPSITTAQRLKIYPNPTKDGNVILVLDKPQNIAFEVITINGQIIKAMDLGMQSGKNITLPLQGLSKGTYFIKIRQNEHSDIVKIIIN